MSNGSECPTKPAVPFAVLERTMLRDMARSAVVSMRIKLGQPSADQVDAAKVSVPARRLVGHLEGR